MLSTSTGIPTAVVLALVALRFEFSEPADFDPDVNGVHTSPKKVTLGALLLSKWTPEVMKGALIAGGLALLFGMQKYQTSTSVAIKSTLIYSILATRLAMKDSHAAVTSFFTPSDSALSLPLSLVGGIVAAAFVLLLVVLVNSGVSKVDVAKLAAVGAVLGLRLVTREISEPTAFFAAGSGANSALVVNVLGGIAFVVFAAVVCRLDQHRSIQALEKIGFFSAINLMKFTAVMAVFAVRLVTREQAEPSSFFQPSSAAVSPPPLMINLVGAFAFIAFATWVCRLDEHPTIKALRQYGFFTPITLVKFALIATLLGARIAMKGAATDSKGFFNQNPETTIDTAQLAPLVNGGGALLFIGFAVIVGRMSEWHPALHVKKSPKASAKEMHTKKSCVAAK